MEGVLLASQAAVPAQICTKAMEEDDDISFRA